MGRDALAVLVEDEAARYLNDALEPVHWCWICAESCEVCSVTLLRKWSAGMTAEDELGRF